MLPFSAHDFFAVFAAYNRAVWSARLVLDGVAALLGLLLLQRRAPSLPASTTR